MGHATDRLRADRFRLELSEETNYAVHDLPLPE